MSGNWRKSNGTSFTRVNAYVIRNKLELFSNFTYFLDNPINGDQFGQPDRRTTLGVNVSQTWNAPLFRRASEHTVGLQFQNDRINHALTSTVARQLWSLTRQDALAERSLGLCADNKTAWTDAIRTVAGVRVDDFNFKVNSDNAANSGSVSASKASPKFNLIFGRINKTEFYASAGLGFHSNDARGHFLNHPFSY